MAGQRQPAYSGPGSQPIGAQNQFGGGSQFGGTQFGQSSGLGGGTQFGGGSMMGGTQFGSSSGGGGFTYGMASGSGSGGF